MNARAGLIWIADDDAEMRSLLKDFLSREGHRTEVFPDARVLFQSYLKAGEKPDLVISDLRMPNMTGLELTTELRKIDSELAIIMITAYGTIDTAIDAIRGGAYDYIVKPFHLNAIQATVQRALEVATLRKSNETLKSQIRGGRSIRGIIGQSKGMQSVFEMIDRVSKASANVLVTGASGTGKEIVARAIHSRGPRRNKPFVAINCTAIPENLLESELFGHARGSFTGAVQAKRGLFDEAQGGTIFLDEIGDMQPSLQAKLLRVIQERKIRPVGDTQSKDIDVRVIAATHKDLKSHIRDGLFREDLFYRLSVLPIHIPSLRERKEDIPLLAEHFLRKYSTLNDRRIEGMTKPALEFLMNQTWEGNVRELENLIERAVVLCRGNEIKTEDLVVITDRANPSPSGDLFSGLTSDLPSIDDLTKRYIQFVLSQTEGAKNKAASILGINRRTLYRKEREYGWVSEELENIPTA